MHYDASHIKAQFNHRDILAVFPSIKPRTLISWSEKGLIKPLEKPINRGGKRIYSYENLIEIGFIRELLSWGLGFNKISSIVNHKEFKQYFHKYNYKSIFILKMYPLASISSKTKKRVGEVRWSLKWEVIPISKFRIHPEAGFTSALSVNLKRLKVYIDDGLKPLQ